MSFSVGVLYSIQEFLTLLKTTPMKSSEFRTQFPTFSVASADAIINTSLENGWITIDSHDRLVISSNGTELLKVNTAEARLRLQLYQMIEKCKPSWSSLLHYGRTEASKHIPKNVLQCLREACLLDSIDEEIIAWWDRLASIARGVREDYLLEIGRGGERLSIEYERVRTGSVPSWQAIESNKSGYDLLSRFSDTDNRPLMIEVKTSSKNCSSIDFHITRNEWEVAILSRYKYLFHVWSLLPSKQLFILDVESMEAHIPSDNGFGSWESVYVSIERELLTPASSYQAETVTP
ncbi:hypothetical protein I532_03725 [Brevibacillus borstelensis AK1]|uniref:Protein NO VEIN C-terminal domain-containing protein n=1 Tax=Brevibacillus borstelensis AK1 TaxID=1300222 RepID=M8DM37_9BACL|nr:DUF3883 domain-containing protein [Brevibacillus borstelensis]EMT54683.1 hypothetical protein I532_03725 [Brevibacillus borstelensis AK1]